MIRLKNKETFLLLWDFYKSLIPYWFVLFVSLLADTILAIIRFVPPLLSVIIFDHAYPHRDLPLLTWVILLGLVLHLFDFFFAAVYDYLQAAVHFQLSQQWGHRVFSSVVGFPLSKLEKYKIGDLSVRLTDNLDHVLVILNSFFHELISLVVTIGFFCVVAFSMNAQIAIMALLSIPLYLIESHFYATKMEEIEEATQKIEGEHRQIIQNSLYHIRTVKAYSAETGEINRFTKNLKLRSTCDIKERLVNIISAFTNSFTLKVWGTFMLWFMGYEVVAGRLSIGEVVALGLYIPQLPDQFKGLTALYTSFRVSLVSMRRLDEILYEEQEPVSPHHTAKKPIDSASITVKNLSFAYNQDQWVLKHLSLEVPKGSSVGIVGASGAGKSTLLNLLLGFYKSPVNTIFVNDQDITTLPLNALRQNMAPVLQETSVFPMTILENILYGNTHAGFDDVVHVAKQARIHDWIQSLPEGYQTVVHSDLPSFSGGQRQRLAIARALLRKSPILVFDEATSALDAENEYLIQEAMSQCFGKKTLIIVAHRLSTIKKMDQIIVLEDGEMAERGTYQSLLDQKGIFYRYHSFQFGGFESFWQRFEQEFKRYQRYKSPLSLVIFRPIEYHRLQKKLGPDEFVRLMTEINLCIAKKLRIMDFHAVYDRNHVVVCLPQTSARGAQQFCDRVLHVLKGTSFNIDKRLHFQTGMASFGESSFNQAKTVFSEDLFHRALKELDFGAERT